MISPEYIVSSGGSCLEFLYHMCSSSTSAFNVFLEGEGEIQGVPLWTLSGDEYDL